MILVTGAAGFIGYHVTARLLADGAHVIGVDDLNPYYDPNLKRARLDLLTASNNFVFAQLDIADPASIEALFASTRPELVIHLAAQAGVRHSIDHPHTYAESNITGFLNILEGCRRSGVAHLLYASSSSVYGANREMPYSVTDRADAPLSLYAATKRANELMAHAYTHLYRFATTGLRFFTVYGPWGRPDMAPMKFARAIQRGERIDVYNYGRMQRDFTYIDDIVEGVSRIASRPAQGYRLFNIGSDRPVSLLEFITALERSLGRRARKRFLPMQPGDVVSTHADVEDFCRFTGFRPSTPLSVGIEQFAAWYRGYYGESKQTADQDRRGTNEYNKHDHSTLEHTTPERQKISQLAAAGNAVATAVEPGVFRAS
jgi:UDP-glucuronate 4-epimerase